MINAYNCMSNLKIKKYKLKNLEYFLQINETNANKSKERLARVFGISQEKIQK